MSRNRRHELGVGVLVLVALGLLAYMALQVGALRGFGRHVVVTTRLSDAAGLSDGATVKIAGVDVGRVTGMGIVHDQAELTLEVREDAAVRTDALVRVRARSVLGEKFIELVPRSTDAPLAATGDQLEAAPTPIEIDQLVNDIGPLVAALDPATLQRSLDILDRALAEDPERIERMLQDLEVVLDNAAAASAELPALAAEGREALRVVKAAGSEARPVIAKADRIATQVEAGTADLATTRAELDGLLADTRVVVADGGRLVGRLEAKADTLELVLDNVAEIDKWELRRLLREEGILVRLKRSEVVVAEDEP